MVEKIKTALNRFDIDPNITREDITHEFDYMTMAEIKDIIWEIYELVLNLKKIVDEG